MNRCLFLALCVVFFGWTCELLAGATNGPAVFGPINVEAHGGGPGLIEWFDGPPPTAATTPWTVSAWVRPASAISTTTLVAGFGDGIDYVGSQRFLGVDTDGWFFWIGNKGTNAADIPKVSDRVSPPTGTALVIPNQWQHLAATFDGMTLNFYVNGKLAASEKTVLTEAAMQPLIAPPPAWKTGGCFSGRIANFEILSKALSAAEITASMQVSPTALDALTFQQTPAEPTPNNRWAEFRGTRTLCRRTRIAFRSRFLP